MTREINETKHYLSKRTPVLSAWFGQYVEFPICLLNKWHTIREFVLERLQSMAVVRTTPAADHDFQQTQMQFHIPAGGKHLIDSSVAV